MARDPLTDPLAAMPVGCPAGSLRRRMRFVDSGAVEGGSSRCWCRGGGVVAGEGTNGQQGQGREDDQADTQPGGLSDACHGQRWNATIKALSSNVITAPCRLFACSTVGFLRTSDMCIGQALYRRAKALKIQNITREFIGKPMLDTDLTHLGAEALSIFCVI